MAEFLLELMWRFGSALDGYPVDHLLCFLGAAAADERLGRCIVEKCLSSWIASLDAALDDYPSKRDGALRRLEHRQRDARDALVSLKVALQQFQAD